MKASAARGLDEKVRHIAAVLWLSNGVHFIQVAKWLGHSSYVLMLTTYAD
jgi:integrase